MVSRQDSNIARKKRHVRVRGKISGTAECPRLNVYRSLANIYVQLVYACHHENSFRKRLCTIRR